MFCRRESVSTFILLFLDFKNQHIMKGYTTFEAFYISHVIYIFFIYLFSQKQVLLFIFTVGDVAYPTYQMFVFVSCFVGHCLYIYNRRVFQFVLPHIMNEGVFSGKEISKNIIAYQYLKVPIMYWFKL